MKNNSLKSTNNDKTYIICATFIKEIEGITDELMGTWVFNETIDIPSFIGEQNQNYINGINGIMINKIFMDNNDKKIIECGQGLLFGYNATNKVYTLTMQNSNLSIPQISIQENELIGLWKFNDILDFSSLSSTLEYNFDIGFYQGYIKYIGFNVSNINGKNGTLKVKNEDGTLTDVYVNDKFNDSWKNFSPEIVDTSALTNKEQFINWFKVNTKKQVQSNIYISGIGWKNKNVDRRTFVFLSPLRETFIYPKNYWETAIPYTREQQQAFLTWLKTNAVKIKEL